MHACVNAPRAAAAHTATFAFREEALIGVVFVGRDLPDRGQLGFEISAGHHFFRSGGSYRCSINISVLFFATLYERKHNAPPRDPRAHALNPCHTYVQAVHPHGHLGRQPKVTESELDGHHASAAECRTFGILALEHT